MNSLVFDWAGSSSFLLWFIATLVQVSLLAGIVLVVTRCLQHQPVMKHSLLMVTLLLMVIAPWSTFFLQRAGFGVFEIVESPLPMNVMNSNIPSINAANGIEARDTSRVAGETHTDPNALNPSNDLQSSGELVAESDARKRPRTAEPTRSLAASPMLGANEFIGTQSNIATKSKATSHYWMRSQSWRSLLSAFAILWLIGCGAMASRWLVAWTRLRQIIGQSKPVNAVDIDSAYLAACRISGCNPQAVRLVTSPSIATPVVAGLLRPAIVIPEKLLERVSVQQLVQIFIHELAHIVRRDQLVLTLQQIARLLFWAHPLVHRVCQRLTQASEEICDNYVLTESSTKTYSQTLLIVAELATGRRNPLGTVGVVGGWSLTDRIAGLLDTRRERETRLSGRSRVAVACLAFGFSIVLLLNFKQDFASASAEEPVAQEKTPPPSMQDGIRSTGDQLEFRLHGRLLNGANKPLVNPTVTVSEAGSDQTYPATVVGDRYELWLPAKSLRWFSPRLEAKSEDGRTGVVLIGNSRLRKAISEGVDIPVQYPTREIKISVRHNHQPVADAHIKLLSVSSPIDVFARSDANGEAIIKLNGKPNVTVLTAWTDSGLIGGYQTHQTTSRDPDAAEHVIELFECQTRKIEVVDTDGSPVEGVRLKLHVATPKHDNYFGNPTGSDVVTDSTGTANYQWFPKLEGDVHHYAELKDGPNWKLHSQRNTESTVKIVVARPAERIRVAGQVSRGGKDVAGIVVQAHSFQGEQKGHSDVLFGIADQEGNFSFDALPDSTYSLFIIDDQWVSAPYVLAPVDPKSGRKNSPYLMAMEGQPVTIQLTSGPDRNPIAGQSVTLVSEIPYSWRQDGEKQSGTTHRQIFATTDEKGMATAFVPLGALRVSVYTSSWRTEKTSVVSSGKQNRITLHREQETATKVAGKIVLPPSGSVNLKKLSLSVQAIDGQLSEEFTPTVNASGQFNFATKASMVGCFAYSEDGQWAGTTLIDDLSQFLSIELHPTAYLSGQLLDGAGKPIADHGVYAEPWLENPVTQLGSTGFSTSMKGQPVATKTDAQGNYRIGPLPRLIKVGLWCDATENDVENERSYLGKHFIELDENRPPKIHRLGPEPKSTSNLTSQERMTELVRDARLGGYHVMAILANFADERCSRFVQENLLDYESNIQVSTYMQIRYNTEQPITEARRAFADSMNWSLPPAESVTAIALDADGKELGRVTIDTTTNEAKAEAVAFIEKHSPPVVDAQQKWDEAFTLAKKSGRRVWVRISQRYCEPCRLLNRWLDDHRELLEKDFVMLKIDDVRDRHGAEIAKELTVGKPYGVPFFAFYDQDQAVLATSEGPIGNIGFISGFESKRHFRKMLEQAKLRLTEEEVDQLLASLDD